MVVTLGAPPLAPTAIAGPAAGRVVLTWIAPTDGPVTSYRIQMSIAGGAWNNVVGNTNSTATTRTLTGLNPGSVSFRVAANYTAGGRGAYSPGSTAVTVG
jgi:hypothetical protein